MPVLNEIDWNAVFSKEFDLRTEGKWNNKNILWFITMISETVWGSIDPILTLDKNGEPVDFLKFNRDWVVKFKNGRAFRADVIYNALKDPKVLQLLQTCGEFEWSGKDKSSVHILAKELSYPCLV